MISKYLELSLRRVRALPKDSRIGFDCNTYRRQRQGKTRGDDSVHL
jgi:hypothetical protein